MMPLMYDPSLSYITFCKLTSQVGNLILLFVEMGESKIETGNLERLCELIRLLA
jgi:hypothetical protein